MNKIFTVFLTLCLTGFMLAFVSRPPKQIIVDAIGKGDIKTIQEALNNLRDSSATGRVIV